MLLLAGEKEERTLDFLDNLTGRRGPIWWSKVLAGASLTLYQTLAMSAIAVALGVGSWGRASLLLIVGLYGLAWGMLAGALLSNVLRAVLLGIIYVAGCGAAPFFFTMDLTAMLCLNGLVWGVLAGAMSRAY